MLDMMIEEINRQSLRALIMRRMFCPCQSILDIDSAGSVEVRKGGKISYINVFCPRCYPKVVKIATDKVEARDPDWEEAEFYTVKSGTRVIKHPIPDKAEQLPLLGGE